MRTALRHRGVRCCTQKGVATLLRWTRRRCDLDLVGGHTDLVGGHTYLVRGGYQYTGDIADALDGKGLLDALRDMKSHGVRSVAVTGLFSPVNGSMEARAAAIARNELPDAHLTLSSTIGRIGLLERQNAAILNASLADLSLRVVEWQHVARPVSRMAGRTKPGGIAALH